MLKNGIVKAFSFAALLGVAACNQGQESPAVDQTPATETPAPAPAVAPAPETDPMVTDTAALQTQTPAETQPGAPGAPATQPGS